MLRSILAFGWSWGTSSTDETENDTMVGRRLVQGPADDDGVKKSGVEVVERKTAKEASKKQKRTLAKDSANAAMDVEYEVEDVLDHRYEWKGYSAKKSTWEPEENTSGCPEKIAAYWMTLLHEYRQQHFIKEQIDPHMCWHLQDYGRQLDCASSFIDLLDETDILHSPTVDSPEIDKVSKAALQHWEAEINGLSKARGEAGISVSNSVDSEGPPWAMRFIVEREVSLPNGICIDQSPLSCDCTGLSCRLKSNTECCARNNGSLLAYDANGRLISDHPGPIYECSKGCKCSSKCVNRQVQRGRQVAVEIFRTESRRWAVRTRDQISAGDFVSEIVGEVVNMEEAVRRNNAYGLILSGAYLFELHQDHGKARFVLDKSSGNISNFVRHSCEPNLVIRIVYSEIGEVSLPKLALFALNDIKPGDQLTVDLHPESPHYDPKMIEKLESKGIDFVSCLCGSKKCRHVIWINS